MPSKTPGPSRTRTIAELESGDDFCGVFALKRIDCRKTRNGKHYFDVEIADRSGALPGKVWDADPEKAPSLRVDHVEVEGRVETYKDRKQCNLRRIAPVTEPVDPVRFLPRTDKDIRELFTQLGRIHKSITNPYLRQLVKSFLGDEEFRRSFLIAPAAVNNHHAYVGGLLEHVVSLSEACVRIASAYPFLDRDLLLAGAFFHDIGKVEELSVTSRLDYSDRGRLFGHIVTGTLWIEEHAQAIPGVLLGMVSSNTV
ncbi:3'-5' exoribonuclease YhaM family protein, partial [Planctomycetota bacterium]